MIKLVARSLACAGVMALASPLAAQERSSQNENKEIVVDGDIAEDSGESTSERVRRIGRKITRRARSGKPIARFDSPLCIKVSGMPDDIASLVKDRIEENASQLRGVEIDDDEDCRPNAFLGFVNDVNEKVKQLEDEEPWLFDGLLSFQVDRIYKGSTSVRAWHLFENRNADGTTLPGGARSSVGGSGTAADLVNATESATRLIRIRTNILGAVALIETGAVGNKTLRQIADYATIRLLASVSDDVTSDPNTPPTILTLFNEDFGPAAITDFDMAYLESLYELPPYSRDGQVIAAAVRRYMSREVVEPTG